ncbi:hypothetical protein KR026_009059 [Drosophila bipectinata]|nr:hypothetical protein KR026_009059 [Drosophila bipectinata]
MGLSPSSNLAPVAVVGNIIKETAPPLLVNEPAPPVPCPQDPDPMDLDPPNRITQAAHPLPVRAVITPRRVVKFSDADFPALPTPAKAPAFNSNCAPKLAEDRKRVTTQVTQNNATGPNTTKKDAPATTVPAVPVKPSKRTVPTPPPYPCSPLIQCQRCQSFGHWSETCRRAFACKLCAGPHPSFDCRKPWTDPVKCCHCGGQHTSTYRGCPTFKSLKFRFYNNGSPRQQHAQNNTQWRSGSGSVRRPSPKPQAEKKSSSNYWEPLQRASSARKMGNNDVNKNYPVSAKNAKWSHNKKPTNPFKEDATSQKRAKMNSRRNPAESHLKHFQANLRSQRLQNDPGTLEDQRLDRRRTNSRTLANGGKSTNRNPAESHLKQFQANLHSQQSQNERRTNVRAIPTREPSTHRHQKRRPRNSINWIEMHKFTSSKLVRIEDLVTLVLQSLLDLIATLAKHPGMNSHGEPTDCHSSPTDSVEMRSLAATDV